jgi:hypothetical protein
MEARPAPRDRGRAPERGLSLVELLLATALLALVVGAVAELPRITHATWTLAAGRSELQENARLAADFAVREIRQATDIVQVSGPSVNPNGFVVYMDRDGTQRRLDRRLDAGLGRMVLALDGVAVAEVLDSLVVTGLAADAVTSTLNPDSVRSVVVSMGFADPDAVAQPLAVRSTVLVRASQASWWDCAWAYRKVLPVTTGAASAPAGYSVSLTFDHAALVAAGKSRADGNDVRIVRWTGSAWTQLDRVLDESTLWDTTTTRLWFATAATINASSTDASYYLYYGNGSALTPPANALNVYLFHDDFPGVALDSSKWTVLAGAPAVAAGILTIPDNARLVAPVTYAFGTNTTWEARLALGGDGTINTFYYWCATNNTASAGFNDDFVRFSTTDTLHRGANGNGGSTTESNFTATTPTTFHSYRFNREALTNVRYFQDATQVLNHTVTSRIPNADLQPFFNNSGTGVDEQVDWVKVRRYVSPEPTTTLGAEESSAIGC